MGSVLDDVLPGGGQPLANQDEKTHEGKRPPSTVDFDDADERPTKRCKIDDLTRSSLEESRDQNVDVETAAQSSCDTEKPAYEASPAHDDVSAAISSEKTMKTVEFTEEIAEENDAVKTNQDIEAETTHSQTSRDAEKLANEASLTHNNVTNGHNAGINPSSNGEAIKKLKSDADVVSSQKISPLTTEEKSVVSQGSLDWLGAELKTSEVKDGWTLDPHTAKTGPSGGSDQAMAFTERTKGVAPIKAEYLAETRAGGDDGRAAPRKSRGQNFNRRNGKLNKPKGLCSTVALRPEFSLAECKFGDKCKFLHNLREYLESEFAKDDDEEDIENATKDIERGDSSTDDPVLSKSDMSKCHNYEAFGWCNLGWRCKFVKHHMLNFKHPDGREELVLLQRVEDKEDPGKMVDRPVWDEIQIPLTSGNIVPKEVKIKLQRKKMEFETADSYNEWLQAETKLNDSFHHRRKNQSFEGIDDLRAQFTEPPFRPSEKRRLYFGADTPMLAPLTTQGNLPFRRLCVGLGCELTYSEMMYGQQLLFGRDADWVLLKAHQSELSPPKDGPGRPEGYDLSKDMRFGAQMSGSHQRITTKVASVLSRYCPQLRVIDINCGCPLDAVYKAGAGSALLDSPNKLERVIRGMHAVSGEIPITAKIRTGVHTGRPTATRLIGQLAFGAREHRERLGGPGCAAITLHGRSREQRYTKKADWGYIKDCGELIKTYNVAADEITDTVREPDESTQANSSKGRMWFIGNGDCYSHEEYYKHIEHGSVDSVMIGRGALIKPWLYEEIQARQYLDKTGSQRLEYIEKFVNYGLESWGSDSWGVNTTRRFLLEWMSFSYRYIPVGILEVLPPDMNDRPPAWIGRDKFESKLASKDVADWNDLADHYLGKMLPDFNFTPKYKSNSYDAEG